MSASSYSQIPRAKMIRRIAVLVTSLGGVIALTGGLHGTSYPTGDSLSAARMQLRSVVSSSTQLLLRNPEEESTLLCPTCNCSEIGSYASSSYIRRVGEFMSTSTSLTGLWSRPTEVARYLLHHVVLEAQLKPVLYNDAASLAITKRLLTCPDQVFASNLAPLKLGLPTSYIYTRTGPSGRLSRIGARPKYIQRHVESIKAYNMLVADEGYPDGTAGDTKQLIWLILEDADRLDQGIMATLKLSGLPFVYLAHGPTRRYGKAQWNQALNLVQTLRDNFLGDGPVYNLDDDSYVLPTLFRRIWQVNRVVAWQVGNFKVPKYNSTWEGPFYENGNMTRWHVAGLEKRIFPIDMNAFAINSSEIGDGRAVRGPKYAPFDLPAGESEFVEKILERRDEIEPLCWDTVKENCYYVWHNGWMDEEVDGAHHAMSPPDYQ